jgi:hypothetical protein
MLVHAYTLPILAAASATFAPLQQVELHALDNLLSPSEALSKFPDISIEVQFQRCAGKEGSALGRVNAVQSTILKRESSILDRILYLLDSAARHERCLTDIARVLTEEQASHLNVAPGINGPFNIAARLRSELASGAVEVFTFYDPQGQVVPELPGKTVAAFDGHNAIAIERGAVESICEQTRIGDFGPDCGSAREDELLALILHEYLHVIFSRYGLDHRLNDGASVLSKDCGHCFHVQIYGVQLRALFGLHCAILNKEIRESSIGPRGVSRGVVLRTHSPLTSEPTFNLCHSNALDLWTSYNRLCSTLIDNLQTSKNTAAGNGVEAKSPIEQGSETHSAASAEETLKKIEPIREWRRETDAERKSDKNARQEFLTQNPRVIPEKID